MEGSVCYLELQSGKMEDWVKELVPSFIEGDAQIACWAETGRFLARMIMGFLIFSPVLEKVRTFLVEPRRSKVEKYRADMDSEVATFADAVDEKDTRRFDECRRKFDNICSGLHHNSQSVLNVCYKLCLIGAGINVWCMTKGWDITLGPMAVILVWPLVVQVVWLWFLGKDACIKADDVEKVVDSLKKDYLEQNTSDNNDASKGLKWNKRN